MRSVLLAALVALVFAAVYTAEGFLFRDFNLDEYQVATGYLKDRDPSLYAGDFIWEKPEMTRNLHVCVRAVMRATDWLTQGWMAEPIDPFLLWLPMACLLFFAGTYLLALEFSGDPRAALFTACSFLAVRRTIWDWWGIGPTFTLSARGLVLCLLPLGLWAFLRCRNRISRLAPLFLAWGVLSNLHPLSGWGLVECLGISILVLERFRREAWLKVMVMGCATLLGSAPFIWIWTHVIHVAPDQMANPAVLKSFWDDFGGLAWPHTKFVMAFLQDLSLPFALAAAGFWVWRRNGKAEDHETLRLLAIFPAVVLALTLLVMLGGSAARALGISVPVMVPEHSRNIKFVYLTLPVWMGFAFAGWFRARATASPFWRYAPAILVVLLALMINPPGHKLIRHVLADRGWWPSRGVEKLRADARNDADDLGVALWARHHTPQNALFYFDSYEFRYNARRPLVFCWFDRPCVGFRPTRALEEWIRRRDRIMPLKRAGDASGMLAAAHDYEADYLVILNTWPPPRENPVWSNQKYSVFRVR